MDVKQVLKTVLEDHEAEFIEAMNQKTGWGKNEAIQQFKDTKSKVLVKHFSELVAQVHSGDVILGDTEEEG